MRGKHVTVAGAGGFIGGHIVSDLLSRGSNVRAIDIKPLDHWHQSFDTAENLQMDLNHSDASEIAVQDCDFVINLACNMGGMGFIELNKAACMRSVLINSNLIDAARKHNVSRYFFASSACVYNGAKQNSKDVVSLAETDAYPADPEDGYGWEKLFSERMCRHYREDYGLSSFVARLHNVYGPHGTFDGGREKAPAAICRKVIEASLTGKHEIEIWGDGSQKRSFLFIDDFITGFWKLYDVNHTEPVNLGSDEVVTINQLVDIAENIAGIKLKRNYNTDAPQGVMARNSDNRLIEQLTNWSPSTLLSDGLEQTYRWIYNEMKRSVV